MEPLVSVKFGASRALAFELKSGAWGAVKNEANVLTIELAWAGLMQVYVGAVYPKQEQALLYLALPPQADA
jgi:hypothetical protein